ncbi:peptidyl-glycine alpha-amidating monooxygenase [Elysia marginata]|uniref:Peptidyl-glycine alpha-amidating monooxygenase n=1 Tax=Elysia marginata TaxID=1093978 RepID=A0AAV4IHF6_9GAST|nr:peptidyl-glycine alpha-amidating monooxygenase [Elysia marginata]
MLLYGCNGEPFSNKPIWNCPFMCKGGSPTIMFAWAKNAPPTVLPKGVGLRIGQNTNLNTIVLQVHYAKKFEEDEDPDRSGIRIHTTYEKQPFVAGIFLLMSTWFAIPPEDPSFPVDISCKFERDMTMVPFAYRTHAHGLGKVITGYKYSNGNYTEIGKGNPQWPQAFYPVKEKIEIKKGDILAARCTYDSSSMSHTVKVGATGDDEMCNFYIMFYTDGSVTNPYGQCMNNRMPRLTGSHFPADVSVPLPPNPALEEKAHGHHHHGGMGGSTSTEDVDNNVETPLYDSSTPLPTTEQPSPQGKMIKHYPTKSKAVLQEILQSEPNEKHLAKTINDKSRNEFYKYASNNQEQEMVPQNYDFDDLDPRVIPYEKRENHEYYEDYAANDLREKGLYGAPSEDRGLSRNRHKEFEAMDQQLRQYPDQKPSASGQPQQKDRPFSKQAGAPLEPGAQTFSGHNRLQQPGSQIPKGKKQPVPQPKPQSRIHFQHNLVLNESWPGKPMHIGQVGGIATDKDGRLYIFHRASRIWSARFFMPHGIEIDHDGNAWVTDVALHQVFKIPLSAYVAKEKPSETPKPVLVLGKRFKHGQDNDLFCKPSDVAVLSTGEFFVSDGYCNTRVLKFSKQGKLIKSWGRPNSEYKFPPPPGTFNLPHGVAVAEDHKLVCVADRENGRLQCFDLDGNFKYIIKHQEFGPRIYGVDYCPDHDGILYVINGPGYDGQHPFSQFKNPHDVCVDSASKSVYVGELNPSTVWKLSRTEASPSQSYHHDDHDHQNIPVKKFDETTKPKSEEVVKEPKVTEPTVKEISTDQGELLVDKKKVKESSSSMTPSLIIGLLLVVPVLLVLIITLVIRAHKSGHFKNKGKKVFNLQGFLGNSHKGFDPLSTEESDHELDQEDSDRDEYLAPRKIKSNP